MWYSQRFPCKESFWIVSHIFIPFADRLRRKIIDQYCTSRFSTPDKLLLLLQIGLDLYVKRPQRRRRRSLTKRAKKSSSTSKKKTAQNGTNSQTRTNIIGHTHGSTENRQNTFKKNPTQIGLACKRQKICQERRDSKACVRTFPTFGNQPKSRGIKLSPKPRNCRSQNEIC